jgi:hypothetical protein
MAVAAYVLCERRRDTADAGEEAAADQDSRPVWYLEDRPRCTRCGT